MFFFRMEEEWKRLIVRIIALCSSVVLVLAGASLFILGIYAEVLRAEYKDVTAFAGTPIVGVCVLAIVVLTVGLLGVIASRTENLSLIRVFIVASVIILLLEVVIGILCFHYTEMVANFLNRDLKFSLKSYRSTDLSFTQTIDNLQINFECCGYKNFLDWTEHESFQCENPYDFCKMPPSCCMTISKMTKPDECGFRKNENGTGSLESDMYEGTVHHIGCGQALMYWLEQKIDMVGFSSLGVTVLQVFGLVAAYRLSQYLHDQKDLYRLA